MSSGAPAENPLAEDLDHVLAYTAPIWEQLRGESIFVTGGTGFFGRWLLESFVHANERLRLEARLVVLTRDAEAFAAKAPHLADDAALSFVTGDVRTFTAESVAAQLQSPPTRYGYVIHAATEASATLNAERPLVMVDTIVQGTRAALEFAAASGVRRFLLTSSGAVYGRQPSDLTHVPEDFTGGPDCTNADSAYGEGKRLAELLCACFHKAYGIEPAIARCFAFVGPFLPLDAHFAIGNFIRDALQGGPIKVGGDGTPFRSYLYAADLAIWLWTLLVRGEPCRPYNVGSSQDATILQIAEAVRDVFDQEMPVEVARTASPGAPVARYVPSVHLAEERLGLRARVDLTEAISRTRRYYEAKT